MMREPTPAAKRLYDNLKAELRGMKETDAADATLSVLADLIVQTAGPDPLECRRICDLAIGDLRHAVTVRHAQRTAAENLSHDAAMILAETRRR